MEKAKRLIVPLLSTVALGAIIFDAFPKKQRDKIKKRAGGISEITGDDDMPMEASHLVHGDNNADNGVFVTILEHLGFHELFMNRADRIGLTEEANNWAMQRIIERCEDWAIQNGVYIDYPDKLAEIKELWKEFLRKNRIKL